METERQSGNSYRLSGVRRGLDTLNDKIDIVNTKLETLNLRIKPVTENCEDMYNPMDVRTQRLLEIEKRNNLHSRKLQLLQKEIDHVQTENDILLEQMKNKGSPRDYYPQNEPGDVYNDKIQDERMFNNSRAAGSRHSNHDDGENNMRWMPNSPDKTQPSPEPRRNEETYREIASPLKREDQTSGAQQPEDKYARINETHSRGKLRDIGDEESEWRRRAQIYSCYDTTAINPQLHKPNSTHSRYPWGENETHPYPGGFLIMRFEDAGYDVANVALKMQQSVCRHAGGYLLGTARRNRIFLFESAPSSTPNWHVSKLQQYDDCRMTDDAIAMFWFTRKEAAEYFFENSYRNRFRESCFPTPNGHEAYYVPLLEAPTRQLNTFFCIEFLDAHLYDSGSFTQFEGEVRKDMLQFFPDCHPIVVSSQTGRVMLKPGNMISLSSKLFISRFESPRDVDRIWKSGMITALRKKWNLNGPMNVYSFTIDIAF